MAQIISPIPPIEPGEERVIHTTWYYDPNKDPVVFNLEAIADYYSGIEELREDNNNLIKKFTNREPLTDILAHIVVHAHNPEGYEIGGIENFENSVEVFDGESLLGHADGVTELLVTPGHRTIKAVFNGIEITQEAYIVASEVAMVLTFEFTRTEFDFVTYMNGWGIDRYLENVWSGPSNNDFISVPSGLHEWSPHPTISHTLDSNPRNFTISGLSRSTVLFNGTDFNVDLYSELVWDCPGTNDFVAVSKSELVAGSAYIIVSPPTLPAANFTNWIFQCTLDGWMAGLAVKYQDEYYDTWILPSPVNMPFIHVNEKHTAGISTTIPILEWKISLVYSVFDMVAQSLAASWYGDPRKGAKNASTIRAGTLTRLKFSSVPYAW